MLKKILDKLRDEPVRVRLYAVVVLVAGYLLARGYVDATDYQFILSLVAAVLGVEAARSKVSPAINDKAQEDEHADLSETDA
ncbi:phage holin [Kribbella sp. WER1]